MFHYGCYPFKITTGYIAEISSAEIENNCVTSNLSLKSNQF